MVIPVTFEIFPAEILYSPEMMRSSVDFPVPFRPIKPIRSPGLICQLASLYKARLPNSKVMLFSVSNVSKKICAKLIHKPLNTMLKRKSVRA